MSPRSLIETRALRRHFQMGGETVRALDGVDITIASGELVAIIGQSGSGKSTLMNLLGCLDTPTSGTYHLAGTPIEDLDAEDLAFVRNRSIGFVFQSFQLLPRQSAVDNVSLPLTYQRPSPPPMRERRARARAMLAKVGLAERADHRPNEMSGGQRQRVAIARALVTQPDLVLADEPTGNLDSHTTEEILELLTSLHREEGTTVIIVTHEPEVADRCERVIRLRDGKVESDTRKRDAHKASGSGASGGDLGGDPGSVPSSASDGASNSNASSDSDADSAANKASSHERNGQQRLLQRAAAKAVASPGESD